MIPREFASALLVAAVVVALIVLAVAERHGFGCGDHPEGPTLGGVFKLYGC